MFWFLVASDVIEKVLPVAEMANPLPSAYST